MVTDADLACPVVFAVTLSVTVPFPLPVAPAVTPNHDACSDVDQVHPADDVTANDTEPPVRTTDCDVGDTAYVHDTPD